MNNGVENNQIAEPILVPMEPTSVPETTPMGIPINQTLVPTVQPEASVEPVIEPTAPIGVQAANMPIPVMDNTLAPTVDNTTEVLIPAEPVIAETPAEIIPQETIPAPVAVEPVPETVPQPIAIETTPETTPVVEETAPPPTITFATTPKTTPEDEKEKEEEKTEEKGEDPAPVKKKRGSFSFFLFILLIGLGAYTYYTKTTYEREIIEQQYRCSPVYETKQEVALDLNSTLVQELYQKVETNIREDSAQPEWNDKMKLYLAFRQIPDYKIYDSNCNMFSAGKMEPYTCEESAIFKPRAFKVSTLELEWKKLYGEETQMPLINVHLETGCIGGYEYIAAREEYVQGYCKQALTNTYKVKKELVEAVTTNNTIILKEKVEYMGTDNSKVPSYLVSGTYFYTFRLDMNYNYILVSKQYDQKYE